MPTECCAKPSHFTPVEGRAVVAEFDAGAVTSGRSENSLACATLRLDWA
ncbi:hypothetical protein M2322_004101 [Rhodoblastus acidophilus]|nr:hypothetical protein [Rhodoblastus acidophilus]